MGMRKDWGGIAATSGATGEAERARQTPQGRRAARERLRAMAVFYRNKGDETEARNYERQARAIAA